ncbi:hypothetical protein AB0P13_23590 [Rhodococcus pyridinivorans]|uniref:hypothetical protein n=1 Tax=Rhodococcus pyridinivorans TaxID=103816 RepID=UPI00342CC91D
MKSVKELVGKPSVEQYASAAVLAFAGTLLIVLFILGGTATIGEWVTRLVAVASVVVALLSRRQSKRSADAAERNAELAASEEIRRRHRLVLDPHPVPFRHVLRNAGTVAATHVEVVNRGDYARARFVGPEGPVTIEPGQARAVDLLTTWGKSGVQVTFEWIPEGETEKKMWTEVIYPSASEIAGRGERQEDSVSRRRREESVAREERREVRSLILQLGDAYAQYKADPAGVGNRLRVQLLTAALPPDLAREIGYEVDIPRHVWGPEEYPFHHHLHPDDAHLIEGIMPELELIWNMRHLEGSPVYGPTEAVGPETEPRIWWAIQGYVERVKDREAGVRHTRRSPEDQRSHDQAMAEMQQFRERWDPDNRRATDPPRTQAGD